MKQILKQIFAIAGFSALLVSCSKSDRLNNSGTVTDSSYSYVLLTNESDSVGHAGTGYIQAHKSLSGNISNIGSNTLQIAYAFGFTQYGKYIFNRSNVAGNPGIQKFFVDENGKISDAGFISISSLLAGNFHIVNDTVGYYWDPGSSFSASLSIQKFNPTTMQRIGQIDLSSVAVSDSKVGFQSVGEHVIADKEGKLFVGITYGALAKDAGYGDDVYDYVKMAVIDIATSKLEKVIQYDGIKSLGWGSSANPMWTLGDDGALYFCATGMSIVDFLVHDDAGVIRIKKGETDFDKNWSFKVNDFIQSGTTAAIFVTNGKMYAQLPSAGISAFFTNFYSPIWDYYAIDISTNKATKVSGMPQSAYAWSNAQAIVRIDGKIYLWVSNPATGENSYYVLNESTNSATKAFQVTDGGTIGGFIKLNN